MLKPVTPFDQINIEDAAAFASERPRYVVPSDVPLNILSYSQMQALPDPTWLIQGLLREGGSHLLFGPSNSFKSFLATDMALSVASGKGDWHGHEISDGWSVIYCATEGQIDLAKQRIPAWYSAHDTPEEDQHGIFSLVDEIDLDSPDAAEKICVSADLIDDWIYHEGGPPSGAIRLIIFDIFGGTMMGSETSDETARAWVKSINAIQRHHGCATLTLAHTPWADTSRARMHSHFWGSFDTRMRAIGNADSLNTKLEIDRHRDASSDGEWRFDLKEIEFAPQKSSLYPVLNPDAKIVQKPRVSGKSEVAYQALLDALRDHGKTYSDNENLPSCPVVRMAEWKTACSQHGLSDSETPDATRKAFNRAKIDLLNKNLVRIWGEFIWKC